VSRTRFLFWGATRKHTTNKKLRMTQRREPEGAAKRSHTDQWGKAETHFCIACKSLCGGELKEIPASKRRRILSDSPQLCQAKNPKNFRPNISAQAGFGPLQTFKKVTSACLSRAGHRRTRTRPPQAGATDSTSSSSTPRAQRTLEVAARAGAFLMSSSFRR
jgi:hypothetical protein